MPKYTVDSNYERFRIVPTETRFLIQERRSFLGLWDKWKTLKSYSYAGDIIIIFDSVEEAKKFIDTKIEQEQQVKRNKIKGIIYYP